MDFSTFKTSYAIPHTALKALIIKSIFFKMAVGGHFGFSALKNSAHPQNLGTLANFLIYVSENSNPLRNEPRLSTVTDLFSMTQLKNVAKFIFMKHPDNSTQFIVQEDEVDIYQVHDMAHQNIYSLHYDCLNKFIRIVIID